MPLTELSRRKRKGTRGPLPYKQMASLSVMAIMIQEFARMFVRSSQRMIPADFHIKVEESFYVPFEARRHSVMHKQAIVHLEAVIHKNGDHQV